MNNSPYHWFKQGSRYLFFLFILLILVAVLSFKHQYWDDDQKRGAAPITQDQFGDQFNKSIYLKQNWEAEDSLWFYSVSQGSDLMPYDFFFGTRTKR